MVQDETSLIPVLMPEGSGSRFLRPQEALLSLLGTPTGDGVRRALSSSGTQERNSACTMAPNTIIPNSTT